MKSYITIRDKCNLTNQSNIPSRANKGKYSEIKFTKINISRCCSRTDINIHFPFPRRRRDLNKVKTYMVHYSSFRIYKILNHNFSIYNFIDRKIRNNIHDIAMKHTYPINKRAKIKQKLVDCLGIKIKNH